MRLSYLSWAFAIIFVMAIMHAPEAEAKAIAEAEPIAIPEAEALAIAEAEAFPLALSEADPGFGAIIRGLGRLLLKLLKAVGPTAIEVAADQIVQSDK